MYRIKKRQLDRRIEVYGGDILKTKTFKRMLSQTHHMRSSVGEHSLQVARMGLLVSEYLRKRGISIDDKKLVRISLLHDLGMLGRYNRYQNNFECGRLHPGNSAKAARRLWKDIDPESLGAIRSHMWPLSFSMPHTKEGWVLCLADKMAAVLDVIQMKRREDK